MITGRGNYTEDINLPGMLHLVVVRSPEAHATITSIDTSAAKERSGVVAVLTGEDMAGDFAGPLPMVWVPPGVEIKTPEHWPLEARRGQARGRSRGRGGGHEPARRGGRRRGRDRGVRPEARRGGPGGGARGRLAARLGAVRHQQDARVGGGRRRHRRRPRRGGGHGGAPLREPPHLAARRSSRAARWPRLAATTSRCGRRPRSRTSPASCSPACSASPRTSCAWWPPTWAAASARSSKPTARRRSCWRSRSGSAGR